MVAEREGFEPPIPLRVCLISSQVHSTGLCHLSVVFEFAGRESMASGRLIFDENIASATSPSNRSARLSRLNRRLSARDPNHTNSRCSTPATPFGVAAPCSRSQ